MDDDICNKCKQKMKQIRQEIIKDTPYNILKCEKCKVQIARAEN